MRECENARALACEHVTAKTLGSLHFLPQTTNLACPCSPRKSKIPAAIPSTHNSRWLARPAASRPRILRLWLESLESCTTRSTTSPSLLTMPKRSTSTITTAFLAPSRLTEQAGQRSPPDTTAALTSVSMTTSFFFAGFAPSQPSTSLYRRDVQFDFTYNPNLAQKRHGYILQRQRRRVHRSFFWIENIIKDAGVKLQVKRFLSVCESDDSDGENECATLWTDMEPEQGMYALHSYVRSRRST